jgi:hypothetical protein
VRNQVHGVAYETISRSPTSSFQNHPRKILDYVPKQREIEVSLHWFSRQPCPDKRINYDIWSLCVDLLSLQESSRLKEN